MFLLIILDRYSISLSIILSETSWSRLIILKLISILLKKYWLPSIILKYKLTRLVFLINSVLILILIFLKPACLYKLIIFLLSSWTKNDLKLEPKGFKKFLCFISIIDFNYELL